MIENMKGNFIKGIGRLKWFATVFSERLKIEIALVKLLHQSSEVNEKRDELYNAIGRRVYDLRGNPERNILKDRIVTEAMEGVEKMEKEIDDLKHRFSDLSRSGI